MANESLSNRPRVADEERPTADDLGAWTRRAKEINATEARKARKEKPTATAAQQQLLRALGVNPLGLDRGAASEAIGEAKQTQRKKRAIARARRARVR